MTPKNVFNVVWLVLVGMNQVWCRARFLPMRLVEKDTSTIIVEETFNSAGQPSKLSAIILHPWQVNRLDPLSMDSSAIKTAVRAVNLPVTTQEPFHKHTTGKNGMKPSKSNPKRGRHNRVKLHDYQSDQTVPVSTTEAIAELGATSELPELSTELSSLPVTASSQPTTKKSSRRRGKTFKNTKYWESYNPLPYGVGKSSQGGSLPFARRPTQRDEPTKKPLVIGIPDSETDFSYASRWFKTLKDGKSSSPNPPSIHATPTMFPMNEINTHNFWDVLRSVFSS